MAELPITISRVDTPEGERDYVSCMPAEWVAAHGLPKEAVIGMLTRPLDPANPLIVPGVFARNATFVEFMHGVIARYGPQSASVLAEGRKKDGWLYVVDQRTRNPDKDVPRSDVFGAFELRDGKIVRGSYRPNKDHVILSEDGFFQLPAELGAALRDELSKLAAPHPAAVEVDPIEEADVYIAYGRYPQAEEILEEARRKYPGRADVAAKLSALRANQAHPSSTGRLYRIEFRWVIACHAMGWGCAAFVLWGAHHLMTQGAPDSWTAAVIMLSIFAAVSAYSFWVLWKIPRAAVRVDDDGLWRELDGKERGLVRWNRVRSVRDRPLLRRLELRGSGGERLLDLEYELEDFAGLHALTDARVPHEPARELTADARVYRISPSSKMLHHAGVWIPAAVAVGWILYLLGDEHSPSFYGGSAVWVTALIALSAYSFLMLWTFHDAAVAVDKDGLWKEVDGKGHGLVRWDTVKSARARRFPRRLQLVGASGERLLDLHHALQDFAQLRELVYSTGLRQADPLVEAGLHLSRGRDREAEEVLKAGLERMGARADLHLKLLEIYAGRADSHAFEKAASALKQLSSGKGAEWEKALSMGRSLDPHNGLYGRGFHGTLGLFAGLATLASVALVIFALIGPYWDIGQWYAAALSVAAALPWVAFWLSWRYPGLCFLYPPDPYESDVSIFGFFCMSAIALSLRAWLDVELAPEGTLFGPIASFLALTMACLLWVAPPYRKRPPALGLAAIVLFFYAYGAVTLANTAFDSGAAEVRTTRVLAKDSSRSKWLVSFHLIVEPADAYGLSRMRVSRDLYRATSAGDSVCVRRGPGALGAPWVAAERC